MILFVIWGVIFLIKSRACWLLLRTCPFHFKQVLGLTVCRIICTGLELLGPQKYFTYQKLQNFTRKCVRFFSALCFHEKLLQIWEKVRLNPILVGLIHTNCMSRPRKKCAPQFFSLNCNLAFHSLGPGSLGLHNFHILPIIAILETSNTFNEFNMMMRFIS